jgi:hypothetical protein
VAGVEELVQRTGDGAQVRYLMAVAPQDWRRRDSGWCMWHHHGGFIRIKLKMDVSLRRTTLDPATLALSFSMY